MITGTSPLGGGLVLRVSKASTMQSIKFTIRSFRTRCALFAFGWAIAIGLSEAAANAEKNGQVTSIQALEFNGYLEMENSLRFSFHDKSAGRTFWLRGDQTFSGLSIKSWDPFSETLILKSGGETRSFSLVNERIKHLELRTLEEIRADPVVAERNRRRAQAEAFAGEDQLMGFLIRSEQEKENRRKARELAMLRELRKD